MPQACALQRYCHLEMHTQQMLGQTKPSTAKISFHTSFSWDGFFAAWETPPQIHINFISFCLNLIPLLSDIQHGVSPSIYWILCLYTCQCSRHQDKNANRGSYFWEVLTSWLATYCFKQHSGQKLIDGPCSAYSINMAALTEFFADGLCLHCCRSVPTIELRSGQYLNINQCR